MKVGDVSCFDSRTMHAGTENRAPGTRRAMFYLSFRNPLISDPWNPTSLSPCFTNVITLNDLRGSGAKKKAKVLAKADPRPAGGGKKKKSAGFASSR